MFFVNLTLGQFAVLMTSATALLLALYLLDRSRRRQVVSTLRFWVAAQQPAPVLRRKHIQQPWSLLLQLLGIALLLLAISQVRWGPQAGVPRDHVLILDTSAWMAARTGRLALMDQAKERALQWLRAVPRADRVMLVRADGLTTPATALGSSRRTLEAAIRNSTPGATGLNLDQAFDFARRFQSQAGRRAGEIVYVGPGRVAEREFGTVPPANLRVLRIADNIENCGLRKLGLRRSAADPEAWEIFVSTKNYGAAPRSVNLAVTFGDAPAGSMQLTLPPGAEREAAFRFRTRAAGLLRAWLTPRDAFRADDEATLEVPRQQALRVTVYSEQPELLRPLLAASPRVEPVFRSAAEYRGDAADGLVILDRFRPPRPPAGHSIWIDPPPRDSPIPVKTRVEKVDFKGWRPDHALAAGLRTKGFSLAGASVLLAAPDDIRIGEVAAGPVIVARPGERKIVVLGFHPAIAGMRYEIATPLLFANVFRWMQPEMFRQWELSGGSVGTVRMLLDPDVRPADVEVVREDGSPVAFTARDRSLVFFSGAPGRVRVVAGNREIVHSQTLPQLWDSRWEPPSAAKTGIPRLAQRVTAAIELWQPLAIAGALCLLLEWFLYGRLSRRLHLLKRPLLAMRKAS